MTAVDHTERWFEKLDVCDFSQSMRWSAPEVNKMSLFLTPWARVDDGGHDLEVELYKEVNRGHPLHSLSARAVARRTDCDDVLFEVNSPDLRYAVVHLTWKGAPERDPRWPETEFFMTFENWIEDRMKPDHQRHSDGQRNDEQGSAGQS
jgi:hypothetical protein